MQLSYATITAPINGVVGSVSTQEGETVAAGLNAPTFVTISDLSRLMVEAYVDEVDIGKVQPGQRAVFTVDAFPAVDFEGNVVAIYPKASIQDNVVKYTVALDVTTPYEGKLRPEMTATVSILLEARNVLAIPSKAVQREAGRNLVYLAAAGAPGARRKRLERWPWTEVTSGLDEGRSPHRIAQRPEGKNESTLKLLDEAGFAPVEQTSNVSDVLAVIIGIATLSAVICIVGTREKILGLVAKHGLDMIMVRPGGAERSWRRRPTARRRP